MQLRLLREGAHNSDGLVVALEEFLREEGYYWVEADGVFDSDTADAVKQFQQDNELTVDGVVGRLTWSKALERGFHAVALDEEEDWPPRPDYSPLSYALRPKIFGELTYTYGNVEAVKVTNNWVNNNITTVAIPQLKEMSGVAVKGQMVSMNKVAVAPTQALFDAWEDAGLLDHVLTWGGMFCLRFVRGSRKVLSNHAWGTAFDINVGWNGLRKTPALHGQLGSVRELVEVASVVEVDGWKWWWGGWGWPPEYTKLDGMHFELTRG